MSERSLAHIERISWIKPIEKADNIELIGVLGWVCIAKKGEFKEGDKAVYIEVDSLCPNDDKRFAFLEPKKYRVKTLRLGKFNVISQGLTLPIEQFPELKNKNIGDDVTEQLKITYYSPEDRVRKSDNVDTNAKYKAMMQRHKQVFKKPIVRKIMKTPIGKKIMFAFFGKKNDKPTKFPNWIVKTDETRCLIGDTKIETDRGVFRISDIVTNKLDVKVKSYNHDTGKIEYKPITSYQKYKNEEDLLEIEYPYHPNAFRKNRIRCSLDHKFFINGKYTEAKNLHVGDTINMLSTCYGDEVIPVIYGMLLGDSCVVHDKRCMSNSIRICTTQGEAQIEYLKLKQAMFGEDNFKIREGKSGYGNNRVYGSHLVIDSNISYHVLNDCYINGKKTITKKMLDKFTSLSLALWYLDDGSIKHRSADDKFSPNIILSTCAYTKEENELLINMLQNKFGVESNLRSEKGKYWSIYITVNGTRVFLDLIKDYIPACMKYKTLIDYEDLPCMLENIKFERKERLFPMQISAIKPYNGKRRYKTIYDLEIADNHNFFANNILTHNCENIPWVLDSTDEWVVGEKVDGTSSTYFLDNTKKKPDFGVCSRNVRQKDANQDNYVSQVNGIPNVYWEMAFKYNIKDALEKISKQYNVQRIVLQGETYGESIQGNPYKLKERRLAAFNLIFDGKRLGSVEAKNILSDYDIPFVPIIDEHYILPNDMEEFKLTADGCSVINPKVSREGFVYRSQDGQRSFKNVSREYLLKHNL